jgi:aminoglycoside 2''-phosphotransferase
MGYSMLSGKPLRRSIVDSLDDDVRQRIAEQLAQFAIELHSLPLDRLDVELPTAHNIPYWQRMYKAFREELFPHMRLEACQQVILSFEAFLNQPPQFNPVVCHGDLGTGNILYDPDQQAVSGIIDFGSSALGDPAFDIASIASCGEAFMSHFRGYYPNIEALESRARFYKSTFALQQALWARRGGDQAAFDDGLAAYV